MHKSFHSDLWIQHMNNYWNFKRVINIKKCFYKVSFIESNPLLWVLDRFLIKIQKHDGVQEDMFSVHF